MRAIKFYCTFFIVLYLENVYGKVNRFVIWKILCEYGVGG